MDPHKDNEPRLIAPSVDESYEQTDVDPYVIAMARELLENSAPAPEPRPVSPVGAPKRRRALLLNRLRDW